MTATVYSDPKTLYLRMLRRCIRTASGCWEFTGAVNSRGYSQVSAGKKGRTILGHQLAMLTRGETVPPGHNIDHACHDSTSCTDIPCRHRRCINPNHIRVLTIGSNNARRWDSGLCPRGHTLTARRRGDRRVRCCRTCEATARRPQTAAPPTPSREGAA